MLRMDFGAFFAYFETIIAYFESRAGKNGTKITPNASIRMPRRTIFYEGEQLKVLIRSSISAFQEASLGKW